MALFTTDDLKAFIPEAYQVMALDDENFGSLDVPVFNSVHQAAEDWISGYLEQAGITIGDPVPKRLKVAAMRYAEFTIWDRRGEFTRSKAVYENWIANLEKWLGKIATGAETLIPIAAADDTADAITEPARTYNPSGGLMI